MAFCVSRFSKRLGKKIDGVSRESMEKLINYPWPGNIRELQNIIERAVILSVDPTLRLDRELMPVASTKGVQAPKTDIPEQRQEDLKSLNPLLTLEEVTETISSLPCNMPVEWLMVQKARRGS